MDQLKINYFRVILTFLIVISSVHAFVSLGHHRKSRIVTSSFEHFSCKHNTFLLQASDRQRCNGKLFMSADGVTENDPILIKLREELNEIGVELDQLMNPAKVVNLEVDLINLQSELDECTDENRRQEIENIMEKKSQTLYQEKRMVMQGWLKNLFLGQSILAVVISALMAYNIVPGYYHTLPLPLQVFGYWSFWMFIIPSLRARKPGPIEKNALNGAFLLTPLISLMMPFITKDIPIIWWANAITTAACYMYAYGIGDTSDIDSDDGKSKLPSSIKFILKSLDFGSGKERGVRK